MFRATVSDEAPCFRPEVALVGEPVVFAPAADEKASTSRARNRTWRCAYRANELFPGPAEWRTGARDRPNRPAWLPAGEAEGERPSEDSAEQVDLVVAFDVIGLDFLDGSGVHVSRWNVASGNQILDPARDVRVVVVVVVSAQ